MRKAFVVLTALLSFFLPLESKDLVLWHVFEGPLAETFQQIVDEFNEQSTTHRVVAVNKGNYKEVFEKGLAAYDKKSHPHILQIYEVATLTAMMTEGPFVHVDGLMAKYKKRFDPAVYIDVVRNFYSNKEGKMLSLPWNASTGILFYNKEAFAKAGLDPEKPPKTWEELEAISKKLVIAGYKGFTTAWPAGYHLEHLSCWHNLPFATLRNGFDGTETRFVFNDEARIFHLQKLMQWQKENIFQYAGRFTVEPEKLFTEGKSAILLQGANRLPILEKQVTFPLGVGFMPYWEKLTDAPYNMNIGGSSFWVMSGFSEEEYQGIVQFFSYLSTTEVQAFWHQKTGFLPITDAAYYLTKKKGFYQDHPAAEIAVLEVMQRTPTPYSQGMRFGNYVTIRDVIIDSLEMALTDKLSAKEALDQAVEKGNALLKEFAEKR